PRGATRWRSAGSRTRRGGSSAGRCRSCRSMGRAGSVRGPVRRRGREGASQRPGTNAGRPAAGRRVAAARRATVRRDRRTSRNERGGVPDAVRPRTARAAGGVRAGEGDAVTPIAEREVLELLREEPELLAIADALVAAT